MRVRAWIAELGTGVGVVAVGIALLAVPQKTPLIGGLPTWMGLGIFFLRVLLILVSTGTFIYERVGSPRIYVRSPLYRERARTNPPTPAAVSPPAATASPAPTRTRTPPQTPVPTLSPATTRDLLGQRVRCPLSPLELTRLDAAYVANWLAGGAIEGLQDNVLVEEALRSVTIASVPAFRLLRGGSSGRTALGGRPRMPRRCDGSGAAAASR